MHRGPVQTVTGITGSSKGAISSLVLFGSGLCRPTLLGLFRRRSRACAAAVPAAHKLMLMLFIKLVSAAGQDGWACSTAGGVLLFALLMHGQDVPLGSDALEEFSFPIVLSLSR